MRIIIPIGGSGSRFKNEGYNKPKPLITVLGKPMIYWVLDNLDIDANDIVHMIINKELVDHNLISMLRNRYPHIGFEFTILKISTSGAAHTVLIGLNDVTHTGEPVMLLDCDTFYNEDIISKYKNIGNKNVIFYASDKNPNPIYSYVKLDNGRVVDIAEKEKISDNANTGCYCFSSAELLKKYSELSMANKENGEIYISSIYKLMLKDKCEIIGEEIFDFVCIGTPLQVKVFASCNYSESDTLRFCFDLDNTLVSYPLTPGDYTTVVPIPRNISLLRFLKSLGHTIIIHTARRMKTHNGNVGAIMADIGSITINSLRELDIPYDELYFGKPYADFYIDDLAIDPYSDLEKDLGFYDCNVEPRTFNKIVFEGDVVKKISKDLGGEAHYYNNIPPPIKHFFPKVLKASNTEVITKRINGISLSYLLITKSLTEQHLGNLMDSLQCMHELSVSVTPEESAFYIKKMEDRYSNYDYSAFENSRDIYLILKQKLEEYVSTADIRTGVIHGDAVLTNILVTPTHELKFIDMRGELARGHYSTGGDILYDYAKIYQSLLGYDFILSDMRIDYQYLAELQSWFVDYTQRTLGGISAYLKYLTYSMIFSLIPLHNNSKCRAYYDIIKVSI